MTKIGVGQVIRGWDEGVPQLSLGEKANLIISADFGYGAQGAGGVIPPNAALNFVRPYRSAVRLCRSTGLTIRAGGRASQDQLGREQPANEMNEASSRTTNVRDVDSPLVVAVSCSVVQYHICSALAQEESGERGSPVARSTSRSLKIYSLSELLTFAGPRLLILHKHNTRWRSPDV